jgi:hypothetical protein
MAQASLSTLPLRATAGLFTVDGAVDPGRWRRPLIVCGTGGRQLRSMVLRGPHGVLWMWRRCGLRPSRRGDDGERPDR